MQLRDFCKNFPVAQAEWPLIKPSKVVPLFWREVLQARMGSILAASDRSRARSSSRLGLALRPYHEGDRLSALSIPHMMRTENLMTRVDESPGQFAVRIFIVTTESLDYHSPGSVCTKGQIALGVAGLIEAIHLRQNQSVRVIYCSRDNLKSQLAFHLRARLSGAAVSILSDFLDGTLESDLQTLVQEHAHTATFYCVRDPLEEPTVANPLAHSSLELVTPLIVGETHSQALGALPSSFSGRRYVDNLLAERNNYETLVREARCKIRFVTESSSMSDLIRVVTESYALARYAQQPLHAGY
jgi:hypothetical protein